MQVKTEGIVLHQIKYSETSIISTIYTRSHGRLSFLLQGVRKKGAKIKANLLQPLFLLNIEMYYKSNRQLQKVKEISNYTPFQSIPYDFKKRTIALFLGEMLYKTLKEEESNPSLFDYIFNHIQILDLKDTGLSNFHIYFLVHLTKYLGFFPNANYDKTNKFFDLKKGAFVRFRPNHEFVMDEVESRYFAQFLQHSSNQLAKETIPHKTRQQIIEKLINFYYIHNPGLSSIKSFDVLKEIFQ
ncbi:MAG: DNA repair protein RecO [Bacteroidales bacterium]